MVMKILKLLCNYIADQGNLASQSENCSDDAYVIRINQRLAKCSISSLGRFPMSFWCCFAQIVSHPLDFAYKFFWSPFPLSAKVVIKSLIAMISIFWCRIESKPKWMCEGDTTRDIIGTDWACIPEYRFFRTLSCEVIQKLASLRSVHHVQGRRRLYSS